jgi:hypothetical protein
MAHLTDLEELLATIPGSEIRDYMREAMNCYMAGAYRGTLVLSYIALFDDLLAKLGELANVNSAAKTIYTEALKKKGDQDVYESYLVDQLTSKSLITGLDGSFLNTLRTLRNKSAHPSGHKPSAEEARFIFYETVSRFLAKSLLSTTHLVDQLIDRLKNTNFFPSNAVPEIASVVSDETTSLHDEAMPQLVAKLCGAVKSTDTTTRTNASFFLIGLAKLDKAHITAALQSKLVTMKADDSTFAGLITQTISANGKLVAGLNATTVVRVRAVISQKIEETTSAISESKLIHPTSTLSSIAGVLPDADLLPTYQPEFNALFAKRAHSIFVVKLVKDKPVLLPLYFPHALARAGSSTFDISKSFASAIESLDAPLAELLSDMQAFQIIAAVVSAANNGTWAAAGVANSQFSDAPMLRSKALACVVADKVVAAAYAANALSQTIDADEFIANYLAPEGSASSS